MEYQAELQEELGWHVDQHKAAITLTEKFSKRFDYILKRVFLKLRNFFLPGNFESGPAIGSWRESRRKDQLTEPVLFKNLLLSFQDTPQGWQVFEQAVYIAQLENAQISALHIVENESQIESSLTQLLHDKFNHRLFEAHLQGSLAVEPGTAADVIIERARWCDLIMVNLAHAPAGAPLEKLRSGFHSLLHKVGQPILAIPGVMKPFKKALLAYDGSPKANEALYITSYLAKKWRLELSLLTVFSEDPAELQNEARAHQFAMDYLTSHDVVFSNMLSEGDPAQQILKSVDEFNADLLVMGSYGYNPLLEVFLGSAIDQVLLNTKCPVLICR
jgi:nucleotide-binding universal stress UspA family protein